MKVKFLCRKDFIPIAPNTGTLSVKNTLCEQKFLVVQDEAGFIGLLCQEDLAQHYYNLVIDCLTPKDPISIDLEIESALEIMRTKDASALPVFNKSCFVGVILQSDIVEYLIEDKSKLEQNVSDRTAELEKAYKDLKSEIVEREKVEKQFLQIQKMEAIGTLAGGIAHDFNNILSAIIGYGEMVLDELTPGSKVYSCQREVVKAGMRAKDLVQQILSFSRKTESEKKPILISLMVKETIKMLRSTIPTTIEIRQDIKDCGIVFADETQLHQITMNLCTNAFQALPAQNGIIEISLYPVIIEPGESKINAVELTPGSYAKLEVSDTGQGIDKDIIDRIFEPYYTTKEKGKGTGLGLSVVHGIVKSLEGHITVYSEKGRGTKFCVYLPLAKTESEDQQHVEREPSPTGNEKILIVDDEEVIADMEKKMLESLGYHVSGFASVTDALRSFQENLQQFDLVITDMAMPEMNGVDFVKKLRSLREEIPVILCTGFSELIDKEKANILNINEFLNKPVSKHELAVAVREVLDVSKA